MTFIGSDFAEFFGMDGKILKTNTNQILNASKEAVKEIEKMTLDTLSEASDRITEKGEKVTHWIRTNPYLAGGIFFMSGFVIAKILGLRTRRD